MKEVFATQSFDVCINAAAYTDVDGAESNKALAFVINKTGRLKPLLKPAKNISAGSCIFQPTMCLTAHLTGPTPHQTPQIR